ncbi:hypothetical protein BT63DRAFT_440093 [Microthyrium microscopicum]|uniref:Store-operated calcium entry-associated regulatory factor n=1 Tax=Microthyrium microscopicum TaxID=703497 RepID=A0A6A6UEB1_9PEZI|nr:hypothetical protein BT63DRAFT_440093 [Microthyrium microscopicum]
MKLTKLPPSLWALFTLSLFSSTAMAFGSANNKVLLKNVQSLTLRDGKMTTHRRVGAVPQLKCVGGNGCKYYKVDVMRCQNAGVDYSEHDIQWTCQASVPEEFKLGSTDVKCEGYTNSKDPFILKGSCGVEYRLLLTSKGMEKFGGGRAAKSSSSYGEDSGNSEKPSQVFVILFWSAFAAIIFFMLRSWWRNLGNQPARPRNNQPRRPPWDGWGGGGPGFGGGGPDDPPPPYSPFPGKTRAAQQQQQQAGWRPGFWSGMAGGAAAGYMAGGRGTRQEQGRYRDNSFLRRPNDYNDDPGEGSSSTTFHQTTGFGGTSNR